MALLFFDRIEMGEVGADFNQIPEALLELLGVELFITNDSLSPEVYKSLLTVVAGLNTDKSLRLANINQSGVAHTSYGPLIHIKSPASTSSIQRYGFTASISGNPTNQPGNWERGIITDQIDIASLRQMSGSISLVSDFNKCIYLEDTQTGNKVILPPDSISDSIPFFVEIEIDRTVATNNVRLYIDNHLEGTLTVTLSPDFYELYIGSNGTHKTYDSTKDKLFYTFFDNIYVSDNDGTKHTERLGSVKAIRVPISNSIQTDFIPTNAPDNISAINKNVGEILSYNQTNNELPNSSDFFSLNLDNLSDDLEIYAVQQLAAYRTNDNYTKQLSLEIKTGLKSDYTILPKQLETFDSSPIKVLESYLDGSRWDLTKLNSTEFGYSALTDIPEPNVSDFDVSMLNVFVMYDDTPKPMIYEPMIIKIDTTTYDPTSSSHRNQVMIFCDYAELVGAAAGGLADLRIDYGDGYVKEFGESYTKYKSSASSTLSTSYTNQYRYWTSGVYELKIWTRQNFSKSTLPKLSISSNNPIWLPADSKAPVAEIVDWGTGVIGVELTYLDSRPDISIKLPTTLPPNMTNLSRLLYNCQYMDTSDISDWDTSHVTNMQETFRNANRFNSPLNWDTSNVTNMSHMFDSARAFNQPVEFDTSNVVTMENMFYRADKFNSPVNFNTTNVTNMSGMFRSATSFNQPVEFDTSKVTNMSHMFDIATAFDQPINFNTSSVTDMSGMFASTNINRPLNFDTSKVTDMSEMFYNTKNFNQPLDFDTSSVTDMSGMFYYASAFNQPLDFDTSSVTNMSYMFALASAFNQPLNFDTSSVTNMGEMFSGAKVFNQPLNFDTSKVTNMSEMFASASAFDQPLDFDTSNVTNMNRMFGGATLFNQPLNFNTSKVTDMRYMFYNTKNFNQPLDFDTSSVTDMSNMFSSSNYNQPTNFNVPSLISSSDMFYSCQSFNSTVTFTNSTKLTDVSTMFFNNRMLNSLVTMDTSSVTNMSGMFRAANAFNQPLDFDTSNVTDMSRMFYEATAFNQPLNFDTSSVTNMSGMLRSASNFNQPLNFDTSNVTNMSDMFMYDGNFDQPLIFSDTSSVTNMANMFYSAVIFNQPLNFDTSSVTNMSSMFYNARNFNQPLDFDTSSVTNMSNMFYNATTFVQNISNWCVSKISSRPNSFDTSMGNWPDRMKPQWGTCPTTKLYSIVPFENSTQITGSNTNTIEVEIPTIIRPENSILLATAMHRSTLTPPEGWTLVVETSGYYEASELTQYTAIYQKDTLTTDDTKTITTWTQTGTNQIKVQLHLFVAEETNKRVVIKDTNTAVAATPPVTNPILTAEEDGEIVLAAASFIFAANSGNTTLTAPTGMFRVSPAAMSGNRLIAATQSLNLGVSTTGSFTSSNAGGAPASAAAVLLGMEEII